MITLQCPHCGQKSWTSTSPRFCPQCGASVQPEPALSPTNSSLVEGHAPEEILFPIGPYQALRSIGKGGMGEVLLVYDASAGRRLALKRIREDLRDHPRIASRFLKEALITSQLVHPAIMPIYTIHQEGALSYYTMPFVEGRTFRDLLHRARIHAHQPAKSDNHTYSIAALVRIFLSICQAVAYAHSKSVLHRDLKPSNILVGRYGQVVILDWGLAKLVHTPEQDPQPIAQKSLHGITRIGKVVGTTAYMAPERALGQPASFQTDIYALGVMLYELLALDLPFRRTSLSRLRKNLSKEILIDPISKAPYRDIPKVLAQIATKCLQKDPKQRYSSVDALIQELETYIEGRAEWMEAAILNPKNPEDWEFQENILISEHAAITRHAEISEWVYMMISKAPFAHNIRIEAQVWLEEQSQGIGFLFNVPEISERSYINEGYSLWIGGPRHPSRLLVNATEMLYDEELHLSAGKWHRIAIEKSGSSIQWFVDGVLQLSYLSRMPLSGTHVGLLAPDNHYQIRNWKVFIGSQNVMVNCLAIPDAFLSHKNYDQALAEYRRIGYSFEGRAEGREAILRAGITLLEKAKATPQEGLFDAALEEFEKLRATAGAPLEYLGKALVYQTTGDEEEEAKCLELGFRRYPHHPLLPVLQEQTLFRLTQSARVSRKAAYQFLLLALRFAPKTSAMPTVQKLISSLQRYWEPLDFFLPTTQTSLQLQITLAFWLHKTYVLEELAKQTVLPSLLFNICSALVQLGERSLAQKLIQQLPPSVLQQEELQLAQKLLGQEICQEVAVNIALLDEWLYSHQEARVITFCASTPQEPLYKSRLLWALLALHKWTEAGALLEEIPLELITQETSLLHYLYGCWLYATEGEEIAKIHWASLTDSNYPRSWTLGAHALLGTLPANWAEQAFVWEKQQLDRQLSLFNRI